MPGGKMAVYTGLLDRIRPATTSWRSDGHEIAHALREHGRERVSQQAVQQGLSLGGALLGVGEGGMQLAAIVATYHRSSPLRTHEVEADRIGVELRHGRGSIHARQSRCGRIWRKPAAARHRSPVHPSTRKPHPRLQEYSAQVMPLYQASRR